MQAVRDQLELKREEARQGGGKERVEAQHAKASDGEARVKASKSGDLWSVDVNDYEHYRIPEAVVSGG